MSIGRLIREAFDKKSSRKMALKAYHALPLQGRAKFKADLQKIINRKLDMTRAVLDNIEMSACPGLLSADADKDAGLQKGGVIG